MMYAHASRTAVSRPRCTTRSARLSAVEVAALALTALALVVAAAGASRSVSAVPVAPVRVEAGQTLWQIARSHRVEGLTTAQTVDFIAEKNGLSEAGVQVGTTLLVPAVSSGEAVAMR